MGRGRLGIYAPTGEFDKTSLANPGLGYWTFEAKVTFSWSSSKIGTERDSVGKMNLSFWLANRPMPSIMQP